MKGSITPDFHLPTEIYIRQNILSDISGIVSKFGSRFIIVTTSSDFEIYYEVIDQISKSLKKAGIGCIIYDDLPQYPNTENIDFAVSFVKKTNCDAIIGFGGVESINAGKAISLLTNNYIFCYDLFSKGELSQPAIPLITMPAHPVFGLEIAPMLFLNDIHDRIKKTYFNQLLYPVAAIVDPILSIKMSEEKAIKCSIATLAIASESVISTMNNDIINTFALKSIDMIFRNLPSSYREPQNVLPRVYLATASAMSGIAFSIAYLSITLSISMALASKTEISIENAMSVILPHIMEFNLTTSPGKYVQMSKVMGEDVKDITVIEAAIKAVEAIRKIEMDTDVAQKLSQYSVPKFLFGEIATLAMTYPFHENAPRPLNANEIETILVAAY